MFYKHIFFCNHFCNPLKNAGLWRQSVFFSKNTFKKIITVLNLNLHEYLKLSQQNYQNVLINTNECLQCIVYLIFIEN